MKSLLLSLAVAFGVTSQLYAQVGHSPERSPYTDLLTNHNISVLYHLIGGNGGVVEVGPTSGNAVGVRYTIRLGTPSEIHAGFWVGDFDRLVIDPAQAPANRVVENTTNRMTGIEVGLNWLLTGKKSWHRLAPYFGASFGILFGGTIPTDPGAFGFNGKFTAAPSIGVRWHPTNSIALRVEGRDILWKLTYPNSYFFEPEFGPGTSPVLDPATQTDSEWTHQPTLTLGLSYTFRY
jgi:hypothetical protein